MANWTSRQTNSSPNSYELDPSHYAYQAAFWGAWLAIGVFFGLVYNKLNYTGIVSLSVGAPASFLISELMARYMHHRGWVKALRRRAFRMLVLSAVAAVVLQLVVDPLYLFLFHIAQPKELLTTQATLSSTMGATLAFWCWSAMYHGIHLRRRYEKSEMERVQLEAAVQAAELRALKSQVNPHFLFNCLNNLRSLVAENPNRAREMMLRLSELLRYALEVSRHERVTLAQELDVVEAYLDLESMQFEDRLRWSVEVAPAAHEAPVPPMLVQQLVENAIKHGISGRPKGGEIHIRAHVFEGTLQIEVENSGQLADSSGHGFGLENARQRLRLLSGELARLTITNRDRDHVAAIASIPLS